MRKRNPVILFLVFLGGLAPSAHADVVINELHYNPPDNDLDEFIEVYNFSSLPADLSGYFFSAGISYVFPTGTVIPPGGYIVVARDPSRRVWRSRTYQLLGPYGGKLVNSGERVTLRAPDGRIVDSLEYSDDPPWPRGADGYGPSLERVSADLPSHDFHTWKGSLRKGGTPGRPNSVAGIPSRPALLAIDFLPDHPVSAEDVYVHVTLDSPELILSVTLWTEARTTNDSRPKVTRPMRLVEENALTASFRAVIPPHPSQTLVRAGVEVLLKDGKRVQLPHPSEPRRFESYFVYDGEIPSKFPIMWIFHAESSALPGSTLSVSGVVIKPVTSNQVLVYDGARVRRSLNDRSGRKVKFLKGEEYRGDRTINIMPEVPTSYTTAGAQSNHVEHIAFRLFRDFGVLSPRCDWYRVVEYGSHTQRIAIQQPNERFLAVNGRNPVGNIYKVAYQEAKVFPNGYSDRTRYTKKTNTDEGDEDLFEFSNAIHDRDPVARAEALRRYLVVEEVMNYEVASVLMSNWDGFFNNMFLYHNPPPVDRWECIPWDLDKTFGYTDSNHMFVEMPLDYPLNGRAAHASREPGPISRPFHLDPQLNAEYLRRVRSKLNGLFSLERVGRLIDEAEKMVLEDLDLLEQYAGPRGTRRRRQIQTSYETMRTFLRLRHDYLWKHLPVSVEDWAVY